MCFVTIYLIIQLNKLYSNSKFHHYFKTTLRVGPQLMAPVSKLFIAHSSLVIYGPSFHADYNLTYIVLPVPISPLIPVPTFTLLPNSTIHLSL